MVDPVIDRKRQLGIAAINAGRTGIDHMLRAPVAGNFQHVEMADQIGLDIGVRVFNRVTDPGLRAKMDDPVEFLICQRGFQRGHV